MFNIHESMFNDIYGLESGSITPPFRVGGNNKATGL
jgi:hypothetical protein